MLDRVVMRAGAAAAMVGAAIAVIFNVLHPRPEELGAAGAVRAATEEGIWALDHYMLGWSVGLGLFALVVIGRSFSTEPSASWGRVASLFAVGSAAVLFATVGVDGFAMRLAAETSGAQVAEATAWVAEGLLVASIASFFGALPVLFGVALVSGEEYPAWLGWTAILAGLVGTLTASIMWFQGFTTLTIAVLFPISALVFTLWIGVMGYLLWRRASVPATAPATRATA